MIEETDVARLMRTEVETTEPPSTRLSVERAMAVGRRRRRGRTGAVALAVGMLLGGAAVLPGLVAPADRSERSADAVPVDPSRIPAALETVDPMIRYARFGWLPPGQGTARYSGGRVVHLDLTLTGQPWPSVAVTLYPRGMEPAVPQADGKGASPIVSAPTAAPEIRGSAATFTTVREHEAAGLYLRWRYAPGGWAEVRVQRPGADDEAREIAVRVAQTLRFSTTDPIPLPARITGVPAVLRVSEVVLVEPVGGPGQSTASVEYLTVPGVTAPAVNPLLRISFFPYQGWQTGGTDPGGLPPAPNSTLDGHQAYASGEVSNEKLVVYDVAGLTVAIDALSWQGFDQDLATLFRNLDLGGAADWRPGLTG